MVAQIAVASGGQSAPNCPGWSPRYTQCFGCATPVDRPPFDPSAPLCATTCESDTDCSADTVCFGAAHPKHCVYRGLQPGQFGALCTPAATAICVTMPDGSCRSYLACD